MGEVLRSRKWVVLTLLVVVAVGVMIELGLWQLRRLHTVREDNARVRARLAQPVEDIDSVVPPGVDAADAAYRRVRVSGRYDRVSEILLTNRSFQGEPGSHVLTPVVLADGRGVVVDRGWIPQGLSGAAEERTRPPVLRPVDVVGVLFPSERRGAFGPAIPPAGRLTTIPRIDVRRIDEQVDYALVPLYLRLESQTPAQTGDLPVPPGLPDLGEGPHLSYAVQWFIFATLAAGTYVVLARRELRRGARPSHVSDMSDTSV
ncbi:MAG: SURF1 family protein [Actinomycetota bacterium]